MTEKISVIVPVYNAEPYLKRCLSSILGQSYEILEVILIDDGSMDRSGEVCEIYAKQDSRVHVIHQENQGPSSARNRGLDMAGGDWIIFVDSDDYIEPDMCSYLLQLAQRQDADLAQCGAMVEGGTRSRRILCSKEELVLMRGVQDFEAKTWQLFGNEVWGKLYRRETVRRAKFDTICRIGEDLHFNFQALRYAKRVVLGTEAKYHYVLTEGSLFRSAPSCGLLLSCREMLERAQWEFRDCPAILRRVTDERYRNALDICSKIVIHHLRKERNIRRTVQCEIRNSLYMLATNKSFRGCEKMKFFLIAYVWPVYCVLLLTAKYYSKGKRR